MDALEQRVGRPPQIDRKGLQEYEATWRRFGAPSLRAFALAEGVADVEAERRELTAIAAEWTAVRDSKDLQRLERFERYSAGSFYAEEARALREKIEAEAQRQRAFPVNDFAANPDERCPVILVLDVSGSMAEENRIGRLNNALVQFKNDLIQDTLASLRVEIAIITFGSTAEKVQDFVIAKDFLPPTLEAGGTTAMGQAIDLALDSIDARKTVYRASGVSYFRPWIWLMSDGMPNDAGWEQAADRAVAAENAKKVKIFAVGIGEGAHLSVLGRFAKERPLRVMSGMFGHMFAWLSTSLQLQANSRPEAALGGEMVAVTAAGEQIKLPKVDWGKLD
jgi:uncharacterized protein YegL